MESWEHYNKAWGSVSGRKFLDYLSKYSLLKENVSPRIKLVLLLLGICIYHQIQLCKCYFVCPLPMTASVSQASVLLCFLRSVLHIFPGCELRAGVQVTTKSGSELLFHCHADSFKAWIRDIVSFDFRPGHSQSMSVQWEISTGIEFETRLLVSAWILVISSVFPDHNRLLLSHCLCNLESI